MSIELLLWALLPFIGIWLPETAAWVGVGVGGLGLMSSIFRAVAPWEVGLAAAAAWGLASGYVLHVGRAVRLGQKEAMTALARLKEQNISIQREHARLKNAVDKFEREENSAFQVYSLAKSLTESISMDSLIGRFTHVLNKITGSSDFLLYLAPRPGEEMELRVKNGPWNLESLPRNQPTRHSQLLPAGEGALLQVPLWQSEDLIGLLWVRWKEKGHPAVEDIERMLEHLIIGFQKAQLFARMESMSLLDGLTGVMRRQPLMDHIQAEWNRASTFKTSFCFMIVDVDHFKRINDTYGHQAGDMVLSRLGAVLKEGIYETDSVGRYGGEEFGILLPRAEPEGVRRKAEGLRRRVEAEAFSSGLQNIYLTISIGLAHFPRDGRTVEEIIAAADRALYAAKDTGRNRVVDFSDVKK